ncbi:right-handed parallel beta-helix repeat-containing protein [Aliifodinibius salicampi]|uniref:Right-handed parallel beta-helix repeat-containing protein n=1 Tax=Fodinibius salicampi TaxID=1920655 RepID=A0ABT3PWV2_9BACT|nr:right-handed parallel beta-helix repeat-containing protein [Fodinibius salicampi]MCW9712328.1 right-handed parallel beta-helix repeat-containing protein [Fodinibius salicampi]
MIKKTNLIGILVLGVFVAVGCEESTTSIDSTTNTENNDILSTSMSSGETASLTECQDTGVGLTAHYINETPNSPLDITCDIGVYVDKDGEIDGVTLNATFDGAKSKQYGIYVKGANVKLANSSVNTDADYPHQFVPITYQDGATGNITNNEVTGVHRAGIVLRGAGTDVNVDGNNVIGIGPKSTGWAQNGIQVDQEASGVIKNNLVEGHFYNKDTFVSSGIGVFSDNVNVQKNTIRNNDLGVALVGNNTNVNHNTIEITYTEVDVNYIFGVWAYPSEDNGIRQNTITSNTGTGFGIFLQGTENTKLIRNDVSGWGTNLIDGGDDTKLPKPFEID